MYLMFFILLIISILITINSQNWLGMWMGMEINLMMFIPILFKLNNKKSAQSMMLYFLNQSIGSITLLTFLLLNSFFEMSPSLTWGLINNNMMMISLILKMGAAPFHFWLPQMMNFMEWMEMFLLMTLQKIAPLFVISNLKINWIIYMSIIMSAIVGAIGGMNTTSLRKIMAYSSINHLSWMLLLTFNHLQWWKYLIIYSMINLSMCMLFYSHKVYTINQMMNNMPSMTSKYLYASMFLSMGGLPPFLGFMPKWIVIQSTIDNNNIIIISTMIMMSIITLFYYMRLISYMMMNFSTNSKWFKVYNNKYIYMTYINMTLPIYMIMNLI
uniref:NADH-ubiquinone oxidoreductase chain 2 n=1 Tax=Harmostica fulvicornis TaxID=2813413 RepID=A0A8T9VUG9_9HEMI|nr:NADH dehydrogenase subunit 2 [Harmostica fulvicornis]UPI55325.1 NADH dehydrogenase subunit 2 [Harmostica fulvicornis]